MPDDAQTPRLLVKLPRPLEAADESRPFGVAGTPFRLRPLCPNEARITALGAQAAERWYLAEANPAAAQPGELWELAYEAAARAGATYAEPDFTQSWPYENRVRASQGLGAAPGELCEYTPQDGALPEGPGFAWHLGDAYSQLKAARDAVSGGIVRIGILDTGYDPNHRAKPERVLVDLQRNFANDGQPPTDASDPYERGLLNNPGHGTGTIGILAGGRLSGMMRPEQNTGDFLGGAPAAEVIPVRIAKSVILWQNSAFVEGLDYLIAPEGDVSRRADVVSMSMGGYPSQAWADVVNRAYEAGIVLVTAAGNNIAFPQSPQSIVWPARFRRVIAACGVMANGKPYTRDFVAHGAMAGNFGPSSKMDTALAAYTPNTSWAEINCAGIIDMDGAGTSSATPQIAAAAALWLQRHKAALAYSEPWMIVEAVRHALFISADLPSPGDRTYFGRGLLRAREALDILPAAVEELSITRPDDVRLPLVDVLRGRALAGETPRDRMLQLEALQLLQRDAAIESTLTDPGLPGEKLDDAEVRRFLDAAIASPDASPTLRKYLKDLYASRFQGQPSWSQPDVSQPYNAPRRHRPVDNPTCRRLRAYAFDPDLAIRLDLTEISQTVLDVPWEDDLLPGPVGAYLEVIDYDPSSGGYYAPVNLNEPNLLAQDGFPPAESDPRFHQQFVYAVAMKTIEAFEHALGRKALWSPRQRPGQPDEYVGKLRIYPHALREANAYYHPGKKALLFGYFPSGAGNSEGIYPQGMIFTCLSHDIVAHETTHALLDGLHPTFNQPTNRDQLAFHEAFADIVALFQHFATAGVVRHQIARTRGNLRARNILGELASQFGEATGLRGALRSYIGRIDPATGEWQPLEPDPTAYERLTEAHDRGALLVAAVFDAFLSIYERRSADLVRLASSGTGELPTGAIHPDLVNRLGDEAIKSARHVLTMCLRALDYCPPLDLTFGDYLRALITGDFELVPFDPLRYRVAFVEAFRRRGIYPDDLTTLSVETLRWNSAEREGPLLANFFAPVLRELRNFAAELDYLGKTKTRDGKTKRIDPRPAIYAHTGRWRDRVKTLISRKITRISESGERTRLATILGLDLRNGDEPFDVNALYLSRKQGPFQASNSQVVMSLVQQRTVETSGDGGSLLPFSGGCTIIADLELPIISYVICKNILSGVRRDRQLAFSQGDAQTLSELYFGGSRLSGIDQRFAMLHANEGGV